MGDYSIYSLLIRGSHIHLKYFRWNKFPWKAHYIDFVFMHFFLHLNILHARSFLRPIKNIFPVVMKESKQLEMPVTLQSNHSTTLKWLAQAGLVHRQPVAATKQERSHRGTRSTEAARGRRCFNTSTSTRRHGQAGEEQWAWALLSPVRPYPQLHRSEAHPPSRSALQHFPSHIIDRILC